MKPNLEASTTLRAVAHCLACCAALSLVACSGGIQEPTSETTGTTTQELSASDMKLVPLALWRKDSNGELRTTSDPSFLEYPGFGRDGYSFVKVEGWIYNPNRARPADTAMLSTWFDPTTGDYKTTTEWIGSAGSRQGNYQWLRNEGFVARLDSATMSAALLRSYRSLTNDNATSASVPASYSAPAVVGWMLPGNSRADLRRWITLGLPTGGSSDWFRNQGGTNRCQAFAVVAALESAYRRTLNLDLDLSEQFLGYTAKIMSLDLSNYAGRNASRAENQVGFYGGGGAIGLAMLMTDGLRVAAEDPAMPFIYDGSPIQTPAGGPIPSWAIGNTDGAQRIQDDANLGPMYRPNASGTGMELFYGLPQSMLQKPLYYGVGSAVPLCGEVGAPACSSIPQDTLAATFEATLRGGHEVLWGFVDGTAHEVMIAGYDVSDPSNKYFIVKDSGGTPTTSEDGFSLFPYAMLTRSTTAGYISTVRAPAAWPELRDVGRWYMSFDGWHGLLDAYKVPGSNTSFFARAGYPSLVDRRVGTFFDTAGTPFRVNGTSSGGRLELYLDASQPALPYDSTSGRHFVYHQSGPQLIAGFHTDSDGRRYPGYLRKSGYLTGVPGVDNGLPASRYLGTWRIELDGDVDELRLTSSSGGTWAGATVTVYGTYRSGRTGSTVAATMSFVVGSSSAKTVSFSVDGEPTTLYVSELNWEPGVIAGDAVVTRSWGWETLGVAGSRQ